VLHFFFCGLPLEMLSLPSLRSKFCLFIPPHFFFQFRVLAGLGSRPHSPRQVSLKSGPCQNSFRRAFPPSSLWFVLFFLDVTEDRTFYSDSTFLWQFSRWESSFWLPALFFSLGFVQSISTQVDAHEVMALDPRGYSSRKYFKSFPAFLVSPLQENSREAMSLDLPSFS